MIYTVHDVREALAECYYREEFVVDKTGVKTVELIGSSFVATEPCIFGKINEDYAEREIQWYESQSLYVRDIPGKTPAIWEQVASKDGKINSNYGYLIYSYDNYQQYANVRAELEKNPNSRRAVMIYNRPSMHFDYNRDGMSDFICTNTHTYHIRDGKLHVTVNMRSNDVVFGYNNDLHWAEHVLKKLARDLRVEPGNIHWQVASLNVYERHFHLLHHYLETGEKYISLEDYNQKYA